MKRKELDGLVATIEDIASQLRSGIQWMDEGEPEYAVCKVNEVFSMLPTAVAQAHNILKENE